MLLYAMHEAQRALLRPFLLGAESMARLFADDAGWLGAVPGATRVAASAELAYRLGRDYEKPAFGISTVAAHGSEVAVLEQVKVEKPFCRLLHLRRFGDNARAVDKMAGDPRVLIVAPLSGHHATLLRDTVRSMLADHDVWITDWTDARMVPLAEGAFDLDDYVDYIREFMRHIGAETLHVVAVCQPVVPVLAAVSLMAQAGETTPNSMTLMGGPIDPSQSPTKVNGLATTQPLSWFRRAMISEVPARFPGAGRAVYPGFLQYAGFIAMNPTHHVFSHWDFYQNLVRGDQEDAATHRRFYDEYNAVLDMAAEYYLDTIDVVFQRQLLPKGRWEVRGERVAPEAIRRTALLTIEGEHDDISGRGQTEAARDLCRGIPRRCHHGHLAEGVGHYGIFSGRRWRNEVYPVVRDFIRRHRCR